MSYTDDGQTAVFPLAWIRKCIATYKRKRGKAPKLLVLNPDDLLDYSLNCTIGGAGSLGVAIMPGPWLKKGEIDLAQGVRKRAGSKRKRSGVARRA